MSFKKIRKRCDENKNGGVLIKKMMTEYCNEILNEKIENEEKFTPIQISQLLAYSELN